MMVFLLFDLIIPMIEILKNGYKRFWVPVMGRFVSKLIPLLEGKAPERSPTYDIDGDKSK